MYPLVKANGWKLWRMNYTFAGKQKTPSLGPYPNTSLAAARIARAEAKDLLAKGFDPYWGRAGRRWANLPGGRGRLVPEAVDRLGARAQGARLGTLRCGRFFGDWGDTDQRGDTAAGVGAAPHDRGLRCTGRRKADPPVDQFSVPLSHCPRRDRDRSGRPAGRRDARPPAGQTHGCLARTGSSEVSPAAASLRRGAADAPRRGTRGPHFRSHERDSLRPLGRDRRHLAHPGGEDEDEEGAHRSARRSRQKHPGPVARGSRR